MGRRIDRERHLLTGSGVIHSRDLHAAAGPSAFARFSFRFVRRGWRFNPVSCCSTLRSRAVCLPSFRLWVLTCDGAGVLRFPGVLREEILGIKERGEGKRKRERDIKKEKSLAKLEPSDGCRLQHQPMIMRLPRCEPVCRCGSWPFEKLRRIERRTTHPKPGLYRPSIVQIPATNKTHAHESDGTLHREFTERSETKRSHFEEGLTDGLRRRAKGSDVRGRAVAGCRPG